jgi:transmembrane 9 superfamily member 2/4
MTRNRRLFQLSCLQVLLVLVQSFYLPGVAPIEYQDGARVELKVNKLVSVRTQLPYGYYTLPYCKPEGGVVDSVENLGEILTGDLIENSAYDIRMRENSTCKMLCKKSFAKADKDKFRSMIDDGYLVNWIVDNLPAATKYVRRSDGGEFMYMNGFPVGVTEADRYYVYNHVSIGLKYHSSDQYEGYRIVGFEVEPASIVQATRSDPSVSGGFSASCTEPEGSGRQMMDIDIHNEIVYTYDVTWYYSDVRWASRWDNYLKMTGGQIHWFSILNSLMIMLFLSGMVAMILLRTLWRDITKYNELATAEEAAEETGWKLVHGDVFRKPRFGKLLAVSVGCGVQILGMSVVILFFALLGFLSPAHRGGLLQSAMLLFTFMGVFGGYASARLYKVFNGDDWKTCTLMTATFYPGIIFLIFFILNLFIWGQKSSGAVPFGTMFALLVLWFGISVPLVFLGSYFGFRRDAIELPVRTNHVPRQIPAQPWFMKPLFTCAVGGVLPFGAVFTELFFIMSSLWQHQFYYLFGFLAMVLCILVITCAEISIALTYFQLTSENYNWWWRSFLASGSSAVYVFLYSMIYFSSRLQIDKFISTLLYFGYMSILSLLFFLLTGAIGMIASFYFVRIIYGSIKVD